MNPLFKTESLVKQAPLLTEVADAVYAFGIGDDIRESELELIASNKQRGIGWDVMEDFESYEYFITNFVQIQGGCEAEVVKPFRACFIIAH